VSITDGVRPADGYGADAVRSAEPSRPPEPARPGEPARVQEPPRLAEPSRSADPPRGPDQRASDQSRYGDQARPAENRGQPGDNQFDRTPPQDVAAEQCVLGGMLLSKDAIADVVEILRTGDFYQPRHASIFDTILDLYGRGEPADESNRRQARLYRGGARQGQRRAGPGDRGGRGRLSFAAERAG